MRKCIFLLIVTALTAFPHPYLSFWFDVTRGSSIFTCLI